MGDNLPKWLTIASTLVTIALTVATGLMKLQVDRAEADSKARQDAFEEKLKERAQGLEELREKTSRYTFVHSLFPDLAIDDPNKRDLTVALIRLTLSEDEAARLFASLSGSPSKAVQQVAEAGAAQIQQDRARGDQAAVKEREGVSKLAADDLKGAQAAFEAAEKIYPTYHSAWEITQLLSAKQGQLDDPQVKEQVKRKVLQDYSWGLSKDSREELARSVGR